MTRYLFTCISLLLLLTACQRTTPSTPKPTSQRYTLCEVTPYGRYYDSIDAGVVQLDLYSEGLVLDSTHHMKGSGYNLCLTDILVSDTTLEEGEYHSSDSATYHTFLPGHDYEGTPHGIYLLTIEDNTIAAIQTFDSATMAVYTDSITVQAYYRVAGSRQPKTYTARFAGRPSYFYEP